MEICCDAMSLSYIEIDKVENYGMTMINLIQYSSMLPKIDNIDFPFENDPQLIGKWESVDFVYDINTSNQSAARKI